jgi:hypothetical protein
MTDASKFVAGSLQALSTMMSLEVPHVNLLTKVDLLQDKASFLCHSQLASENKHEHCYCRNAAQFSAS